MYHLVSAKVKPVTRKGFWEDEDISNKLIGELIADYRKINLTLTNNFVVGDLYLDFDSIKSTANKNLTLDDWFASIGNASLPTSSIMPDYSQRTVHFGDVWAGGYDVEPVSNVYNPEVEVTAEEKIDVLLTRADTDYMAMADKCLFTVNGLLHRAEGSVHGLHIREGNKSAALADKFQIGILSFAQVGDIEIVPITGDMLYKPHPDTKMKDSVYLNINRSLENKSLILVLGGYLHVLDDTYSLVGENLIKIKWNRIPYAKRYFESRRLIDMSSLDLMHSNNPSQISVEQFFSDTVITKYLELSQSFFVLIDSVNLFTDKVLLESSQLPGVYYSQNEPRYPLQIGLGRIGNYSKYDDDRKWVLNLQDNLIHHYNFETTHWLVENSIDDTRRVGNEKEYADGYSLLIGID